MDLMRFLKKKNSKKVYEILDSISEDILIIDNEFRIIFANKQIMQNLNMGQNDILGKHCYEITHHIFSPCKPPDHICPIISYMNLKTPKCAIHKHFDKSDNPFFTEVTAYPVISNNRDTGKFIHVARRLHDEVNKRLDEVKKIEKLFVERELEMINLKVKIKELESKTGDLGKRDS